MKTAALNEVKDDLSKYLRLAEKEAIVITQHGKPAGVLIGFASEDDWFDYRLEHDPRFLERIERARQSLRAGRGVKLEDIKCERDLLLPAFPLYLVYSFRQTDRTHGLHPTALDSRRLKWFAVISLV